jgi:aryl-alcohol dehydrogenase-like predicted oxidoreductase
MEYRQLGNTGLEVSAVGLGGNVFGPPRQDLPSSITTVHHALALGVNFIDTAHIYNDGRSEEFLGKALAGRRGEVILASKCHLWNMAPGESVSAVIRSQCEISLRRLDTDYLDLLQLHFPFPHVAAQEILEAFAPLVREGKVRHIGQCNYAAWRHAEALGEAARLGVPAFATAQHQYSLLVRGAQLELLPFCMEKGIGFLPYFPLAAGLLSGKYRPGAAAPAGTRGAAGSPTVTRLRTPQNERLLAALAEFAATRGHSLLELAFAWLLSQPAVSSVIAGTMNPAQIEANVNAGQWRLSAADGEALAELLGPVLPQWQAEPDLTSFR